MLARALLGLLVGVFGGAYLMLDPVPGLRRGPLRWEGESRRSRLAAQGLLACEMALFGVLNTPSAPML